MSDIIFVSWCAAGLVSGIASMAMLRRKLNAAYPMGKTGIRWLDNLTRCGDIFAYMALVFTVGGLGAAGFGPLVAIIPAMAYFNHGKARS